MNLPDKPSYECGDCTICCSLLSVDDDAANFHKPILEPCKHLCPSGCGIYESPEKPSICSTFYCMYRINAYGTFKESDRPDKLGVLVVMNDIAAPFTQKTGVPSFTVYETRPDGFDGYWPEKLISRLQKKWLLILMPWSRRQTKYQMDPTIKFIGPTKWMALLDKFTGGKHG